MRRQTDKRRHARLIMWPSRAAGLPPGQRLFRHFPRFADNPLRPPPPPRSLRLAINGIGLEAPLSLEAADLNALPQRSQTSDFHCVTTWTTQNLHWQGVGMRDVWDEVISQLLVDGAPPTFVTAEGSDGHAAVFLLEDLLGPDVLLATSLNGQLLDRRHGAPLRLVSPGQYGYKSVKHLERLVLHTQEPRSVLGSKEHLRARVVREERHKWLPPWALRRVYRALIPITAVLAERSLLLDDSPPALRKGAVGGLGGQRLAAVVAAMLVAGTASAHAYWALGGRWPGTDEASLALRVIGNTTTMPHPTAIWLAALALAGAAGLLLDSDRRLEPSSPAPWQRPGLRFFFIATALRALAGATTSAIALLRGTDVPYFRLDLLIYSPLCALLAALTALVLDDEGTADCDRDLNRAGLSPAPPTGLSRAVDPSRTGLAQGRHRREDGGRQGMRPWGDSSRSESPVKWWGFG